MTLQLCVRFLARAVKPRLSVQEKLQKAQDSTINVKVPKEHDPRQRLSPFDIDQQGLSKVRMTDQYLPKTYLKRAQQVFSKYDPTQLRQLSGHFSNLMNTMYKEDKVDYTKVKPFTRLKAELPTQKKVEQIHLYGKETSLKPEQQEIPSEDEEPVGVEIGYTQNTVISYLLRRVPRTFSTAVRVLTEIRYKYPKFQPDSMLDFGSGLSSGSYAYADVFQQQKSKKIFNVQPNTKMFKLSKFLTQDLDIQHYKALGELSRIVKDVDLVYAGYVISQIEATQVPIYIQALWTKVRPGGFLVVVQYGNPYGARLCHDIRKWAIDKNIKVAMPCSHQLGCPLAKSGRWCHFDQPAGQYPRSIFGKLPTDHAIQIQKFSYIVLEKTDENIDYKTVTSSQTDQWDRILFPTMKKTGHLVMDLCTKEGKLERRTVAKSHGKQYAEARKLKWGDLWRFGHRIPNKFRKESKKGKRLW